MMIPGRQGSIGEAYYLMVLRRYFVERYRRNPTMAEMRAMRLCIKDMPSHMVPHKAAPPPIYEEVPEEVRSREDEVVPVGSNAD